MRVLFVAPLSTETATARYRCGHLAEALRAAGHEADVVSADAASITVRHDVVVLHRLVWGGAGARLHAAARAAGAAVLYGVDDLIFEPEYAFHVGLLHPDDPIRYHYHRGEVEGNRATLAQADGVLVSTEFLADRVRASAGKDVPIWVVRNFLGGALGDLSEAALREAAALRKVRRDDRVTLGYLSGSPTHDADLADIAAPLAAVLRRHAGARLLVVGAVALPGLLAPFAAEGRVRRHPHMPWRDLPRLLAGVDVNLAPLDPARPFVHAKSEVKWLEAGAAGVPTIAGWAAGFAEGVRDGEDCLLARTAAEWGEALERLVTDADAREQLASAARAAVTSRATVVAQAQHVAEVFDRAARLRPESGVAARAVVVRRPGRERVGGWFKKREADVFRAALRLTRHWRLLRDEVSR